MGSFSKLLLLSSSLHQAFSAPAAEVRPSNPSPTVTIASGVIVGTTLLPSNQPSVTLGANAYLGVPFAKSPPERFSPPGAAPSWSSPLQAQARKPACVQQFSGTGETRERSRFFFNNPLGLPPDESEDCLYLNIYTPPGVTPNSRKAVMFWLFGVRIFSSTLCLLY
jgi:carboxylesterase 2